MALSSIQMRVRLRPEIRRRIEREAFTRGCSLTEAINACLGEYFSLRSEGQNAAPETDRLQPHHPLDPLFAASELRLLHTLVPELRKLEIMLDNGVWALFTLLPEIADGRQATQTGKRRHTKWIREVDKELTSDKESHASRTPKPS